MIRNDVFMSICGRCMEIGMATLLNEALSSCAFAVAVTIVNSNHFKSDDKYVTFHLCYGPT